MKMKRIVLLLLLLLVSSLIAACGGDDDDSEESIESVELSETFSNEEVTLNYPEGWVAEGAFNFVTLVNSQAVMDVMVDPAASPNDLPEGSQLLAVSVSSDEAAAEVDLEEAARSETEGAELGDFEEVTIGGYEGVRSDLTQTAETEDDVEGNGVIYSLRQGNTLLIIAGLAFGDGEIDREIIEAVAATVSVTDAEAEAATEEPDDALEDSDTEESDG